jgi:polyphosphate glucokinase
VVNNQAGRLTGMGYNDDVNSPHRHERGPTLNATTSDVTPTGDGPAHAIDTAVAAAGNAPVVSAEPAAPPVAAPEAKPAPPPILVIDIGGTKVKILATGQTEPRKAPSGKEFTPAKLVEAVRELAQGWDYEAISIGFPGLVGTHGPRCEPGNLGPGWVGFDYAAAFGLPVKMVNDAAMQALGSYDGGRMLFLGLGTGLGSALIAGSVIVPLELGRLPFDADQTLGEILGRKGMQRVGKGDWRKVIARVVPALMGAFAADYVVLGGGNAKVIKELPPGARRGHNLTAFRGGIRLWGLEDVWVLAAYGDESPKPATLESLRML